MLQFTNLMKPTKLNYDIEMQAREVVDEILTPTHTRVLELQQKMGSLADQMLQINSAIDTQDSVIHEALNLGKGTLESQILRNIDTKIQRFQEQMLEKVT